MASKLGKSSEDAGTLPQGHSQARHIDRIVRGKLTFYFVIKEDFQVKKAFKS